MGSTGHGRAGMLSVCGPGPVAAAPVLSIQDIIQRNVHGAVRRVAAAGVGGQKGGESLCRPASPPLSPDPVPGHTVLQADHRMGPHCSVPDSVGDGANARATNENGALRVP